MRDAQLYYIGRDTIGAGAIRPLFLYRSDGSERNAFMTNAERDYIIRYRQSGKSCAEIARVLGLSANTEKSFCQRNRIAPNTQAKLPALSETVCLCCGEKVELQPHRKPKRFCSDACRLRWWHAHRDREKNAVDRRLQRTDPAKPGMGIRRGIRGFWSDRYEGNAPGISADAERMPRREDRPDSGQVHLPFRSEYAGTAEYGTRTEGAGHRRLF